MATPDAPLDEDGQDGGVQRSALWVTAVSLAALGAFWVLNWQLAFLLAQVVLISLIIWQVCDPFADAAQWIGETFRLPGSIRGATLDAVASSMPELFSGIFFVVVAIGAAGGETSVAEAGAEGYGSTIATCAGSAVYNMILIPAVCALAISVRRIERPTIDVDQEVISRDGMWFLGVEAVLLFFLFQERLYWWMAVVFIGLYITYITQLFRDARAYQRAMDAIRMHLDVAGRGADSETIARALRADGFRVTPLLVDKIQQNLLRDGDQEEAEEEADTAGVFYGVFQVPLNHLTAWLVIGVATILAAAACYWLVEVTRATAVQLHVPVFFVAVILAAAASSVPDTFLSLGSALRGDDSGAVSNAFGSNIFDICICLSIPLLVNCYLVGWGTGVALTQDGEPVPGLFGLRIMLWVLTLMTLLIMWHNRQLTRNKALVLCGLYGVFMAYAVLGSLNVIDV